MNVIKQLAASLMLATNADRNKLLNDPLSPWSHFSSPQCENSEMLRERDIFIAKAKTFVRSGKNEEADRLISKYRFSFFSLWCRNKSNPEALRAMTNCFLLVPEYVAGAYNDLFTIPRDEHAKTILDLTVVYIDLARLSQVVYPIGEYPGITFTIQERFKSAAEALPPINCLYPSTTQDKIESNIRGYFYSNCVGSRAYYHLDQLDRLSPGVDWENPAETRRALEKCDSYVLPAFSIKA